MKIAKISPLNISFSKTLNSKTQKTTPSASVAFYGDDVYVRHTMPSRTGLFLVDDRIKEYARNAQQAANPKDAKRQLKEGIDFCKEAGVTYEAVDLQISLGDICLETGEYDEAARAYDGAIFNLAERLNLKFVNSRIENLEDLKTNADLYNGDNKKYSSYGNEALVYQDAEKIITVLDKMADVYDKKGDIRNIITYSVYAQEIQDCTKEGTEIIKRLAN